MSQAITRAFRQIAQRVRIVNEAAGEPGNAAHYAWRMGFTQRLLTEGFDRAGLKSARLTHFAGVAQSRLSNRASAALLSAVVEDTDTIHRFVTRISKPGGPAFDVNGFEIRARKVTPGLEVLDGPEAFHWEAMKNYSVGLARGQAAHFRQHAHNNHLAAQCLRAPHSFLPGQLLELSGWIAGRRVKLFVELEQAAGSVPSITDLTIWVEVQLTVRIGKEKVLLGPPRLIPVTLDSKVYLDPTYLATESRQQVGLFFHDRFHLLDKVWSELDAVHASPKDKKRFVTNFVPAAFAHYLFAPADFVDSAGIGIAHRDAVHKWAPDFIEMQAPYIMASDDYDLVLNTVKRFADQHFLTGDYLNTNSLMLLE